MPPSESASPAVPLHSRSASAVTPFKHPLLWVPSLYLAMGIPNITVSQVSTTMYQNLGEPIEKIALYTGLMYLPWVLKPVWSPFMEPFKSKRWWVLSMEFFMAAMLMLAAFALKMPNYFTLTIGIFWMVGFASGTQDIAADAVYMTTLAGREQAKYTGVQSMCWNAGAIFANGFLIWLTGKLAHTYNFSWVQTWSIAMGVIAFTLFLTGIWHLRVLPPGEPSAMRGSSLMDAFRSLAGTWISFFKKEKIWMMLAVIFMYRFGEGFIEKFATIFLLDSRDHGGLGLTNEGLGPINGIVGTIGFLAGSLLGGLFAAKMTLRRSFVFLAIALNIPHVTFFLLSSWMPQDLLTIGTLVTIEKFGFGFGAVGMMLYMMQQIAPGPFKMSHYAFATGVMALTKMLTGSISGKIFLALDRNYHNFFIFVLIASIPPIIFAWLAPFPQPDEPRGAAAAGH